MSGKWFDETIGFEINVTLETLWENEAPTVLVTQAAAHIGNRAFERGFAPSVVRTVQLVSLLDNARERLLLLENGKPTWRLVGELSSNTKMVWQRVHGNPMESSADSWAVVQPDHEVWVREFRPRTLPSLRGAHDFGEVVDV